MTKTYDVVDRLTAERCIKDYAGRISGLLSALDYAAVKGVIDCFYEARDCSSTIFFAGNGGSAATASHFAQDLAAIGKRTGKMGFKAVSLTDSAPLLTACANDDGYETIFTSQMRELFKEEDILVAISVSGNSPNIVKAAEYAKRSHGIVVGLAGFDGGKLKGLCDHIIHIKTDKGEYGPAEDMHMIIDHMVTSYIFKKDTAAKA